MSQSKKYHGIMSLILPFSPNNSGSEGRQALQRLLLLRGLVTLISTIGLIVFQLFSSVSTSLLLISCLVAAIILSLVLGFWRLKRSWVVTNVELFCQLVLDVIFLTVLVLYTGGIGNPFISYLLVLLAVGATLLTRLFVYIFAIGSIVIYSGFLLLDLTGDHGNDQNMMNFQLHLIGMWVIFVVSAILITVFVTSMTRTIRARELTLAKVRENELRNEQLVAIGTLAAGTAHALGTPLSTMSVLLSELNNKSSDELQQASVKEDLAILKQQVNRCKESLHQLVQYYHKDNEHQADSIVLQDFVNDIKDYIVNIHPFATINFQFEANNSVAISPEPSLKHAVINLIENGIKAASSKVDVKFRLLDPDATILEISVNDDGPGIPAKVMENMGEPFISTRKDSMGLGIFLANAAIQKINGSIEMFNLKSGGAMTVVKLPLSRIITEQ